VRWRRIIGCCDRAAVSDSRAAVAKLRHLGTDQREGRDVRDSKPIRSSPACDGMYFGDRLRGENGGGQIVAHMSDIAGCSATDLQRALRQASTSSGYETLLVSEVALGYFDEEESLVAPIEFTLVDNALTVEITFLVDDWDDDEEQAELVASVLRPFLAHHRMQVRAVWQDEHYAAPPWPWHASIAFNTRSRLLTELFQIGEQAIALLGAAADGDLDRETVAHLVRAGHAAVLIGRQEGHWLDVKVQHYDHSTDGGQISLCQSVSRFCNAEQGGLVIVGMSAKRLPDGEEIRSIRPVPIDSRTVRRYKQVIEHRLFPPPDNLTIESILYHEGQGLILIDVPPQPEELKPFLVHGAIVDGGVEGAFISIVRRRGETSIPITAPMIHSTLAAGRGLLRRGELPPKS
jgi:hypothetical protein